MYDPNGLGPVVQALRQPAGVQVAGDVVQLPVIPYDTAGPSSKNFGEQVEKVRPYFESSGNAPSNIRGVPRKTIEQWLSSPASRGMRYMPPLAPVGPLAPKTPGGGPLGVGPPGVPPYL